MFTDEELKFIKEEANKYDLSIHDFILLSILSLKGENKND